MSHPLKCDKDAVTQTWVKPSRDDEDMKHALRREHCFEHTNRGRFVTSVACLRTDFVVDRLDKEKARKEAATWKEYVQAVVHESNKPENLLPDDPAGLWTYAEVCLAR